MAFTHSFIPCADTFATRSTKRATTSSSGVASTSSALTRSRSVGRSHDDTRQAGFDCSLLFCVQLRTGSWRQSLVRAHMHTTKPTLTPRHRQSVHQTGAPRRQARPRPTAGLPARAGVVARLPRRARCVPGTHGVVQPAEADARGRIPQPHHVSNEAMHRQRVCRVYACIASTRAFCSVPFRRKPNERPRLSVQGV